MDSSTSFTSFTSSTSCYNPRVTVTPHPDVAVIGAGAFGGWTALHLLERGARIALVDAWEPGHPRGTSSGESRVIRYGYGHKPIYTEWAWRALAQWRRREQEWRTPLLVPCGALFAYTEESGYSRACDAALSKLKIPFQRFDAAELRRRYPQIALDGFAFGVLETDAGFLRAKLATRCVARAVAEHASGRGRFVLGAVEAPQASAPSASPKPLEKIHLAGGETLSAGAFVFACGPWLPQLFPQFLGERIRPTKQDVFFFGTPPGEGRFNAQNMPVWIDIAREFYCIPAHDGRGFKVAYDRSGPRFDPTAGERTASPEILELSRRYLAERFHALAGAPLAEVRICQYERTPDSHLVIDRHPAFSNVWLAGGGSGHGFKLGPAVGEFVAAQMFDATPPAIPAEMRLGAIAFTGDDVTSLSF